MDLSDIIAIFAIAVPLIVSLFSTLAANRRTKKQATLDAYNLLQEQALDRLYTDYKPSRISEVAEHPQKKDNEDDYHQLGTCLARIEHFCVGVNNGIYDRRIVYELAHGFLDGTIRNRIQPLIDRKTSFAAFDPYANLRKVYAWMDGETEKRKQTSTKQ